MTQEFYALGKDRSASFARAFLNHFLPNRSAFAENYPIPECAEHPATILRTENEVLTYLELHPQEPYGLYWNDTNPTSLAQAMIFYTRDECAIFGLADEATYLDVRLSELAAFIGTPHAFLGSDQRPPDTTKEFIALCGMLRKHKDG